VLPWEHPQIYVFKTTNCVEQTPRGVEQSLLDKAKREFLQVVEHAPVLLLVIARERA